jgi:hypothetical protein
MHRGVGAIDLKNGSCNHLRCPTQVAQWTGIAYPKPTDRDVVEPTGTPCQVKTRPGEEAPPHSRVGIRVLGEVFEIQRLLRTRRLRSPSHVRTGPTNRTYYRCVVGAVQRRSTGGDPCLQAHRAGRIGVKNEGAHGGPRGGTPP